MNPGEYPQPLARVAPLNFTAVNGYTGLRLRNRSVPTLAPESVKSRMVVQNVGDQSITLQVKEVSPQYVASGTRNNLGSPITLGISGFKAIDFTPTKGVIEVLCTSGTSTVRAQMESLLNWEIMGLGNLNQDGTVYGGYPPSFDKSSDQLPWSSL